MGIAGRKAILLPGKPFCLAAARDVVEITDEEILMLRNASAVQQTVHHNVYRRINNVHKIVPSLCVHQQAGDCMILYIYFTDIGQKETGYF